MRYEGEAFTPTDEGYEAARRATCWNARTPGRYPDLIVQAASERDVVTAVKAAAGDGMKIGVCSGGHSWAGNHVRDGGLLLDVSRLREVEIDAGAMRAAVGPGCPSNELLGTLLEQDLFFPSGHCVGVAVGGYLLQGGFGWNGRIHGPACMSVEAIDVVSASRGLVRADAKQNTDLFWAARGAGPGFFGVVTRFHLRLYRRPPVIANGVYLYPGEVLEEVFRWAYEVGPRVAREMELMLLVHRDEAGEIEIAVTGPVLAQSQAEATQALAVLESCPVRGQAKIALPNVPAAMGDFYAGSHTLYPDEHRYAADNMWTHATFDELLPGLQRIAETMPPAPSHMLWMNWRPGPTPPPPRPDMAYSVEDDTYIALYGVWSEPGGDAAGVSWVTERMREMQQLSSGIQLADENLELRPMRFVTEEHSERLDEIRAAWDPAGLFHPWMGRP